MRYAVVILPIICATAHLLQLSCGIFTPRDEFEPPAEKQSVVDIYNFGSLLTGTGYTFSKLDWYELFDDSLVYVNVRSGRSDYNKTDLINRLNQQKVRLPDARVTWTINDKITTVNLVTRNDVQYTVADSAGVDSVHFSGNSNFVIRRDAKNVWRILRWTDDPTSDTAFFSPAE